MKAIPSSTDLEEDGEQSQRSCGDPDDQQPHEDAVDAEGHEGTTAAGFFLLFSVSAGPMDAKRKNGILEGSAEHEKPAQRILKNPAERPKHRKGSRGTAKESWMRMLLQRSFQRSYWKNP